MNSWQPRVAAKAEARAAASATAVAAARAESASQRDGRDDASDALYWLGRSARARGGLTSWRDDARTQLTGSAGLCGSGGPHGKNENENENENENVNVNVNENENEDERGSHEGTTHQRAKRLNMGGLAPPALTTWN